MLNRHFLTGVGALSANVSAHFHHFVIAHALAVFSALEANLSANPADFWMKVGVPHHEVSRGPANVQTGEHNLYVSTFAMHAAFFETVRNQLLANSMTLKAVFNALLNLIRHVFEGVLKRMIHCSNSRLQVHGFLLKK